MIILHQISFANSFFPRHVSHAFDSILHRAEVFKWSPAYQFSHELCLWCYVDWFSNIKLLPRINSIWSWFTVLCGFPVPQLVKNLPATWETWVRSLGWEDPLEKGTATHSSIVAWRTQWTGEPGGLQSMGSQRVGHNWATFTSLHIL